MLSDLTDPDYGQHDIDPDYGQHDTDPDYGQHDTDPDYGQHETETDEEKDQMTVVNRILSKGFFRVMRRSGNFIL